jgi:hypothetical protein
MRVHFCWFTAGLGKWLKPPAASPGSVLPPKARNDLGQPACLFDIQSPRAGN